MGNVSKRAAVDERRCVFQCLHQIRLQRILQQCGHCAVCAQIPGINRIAVQIVCHQNLAQTFFQVCQIRSQTENCHHFGCYRDLEAIAPGNAVYLTAKTDDDIPEGTVVHVQHTLDHDTALVDAQHVALLHVVVQHCAEQIVGGGDGVHIAGEVQVDVLHGNDLCIAAAGCTALDAKDRPQRRFPQRQNGLPANAAECIRQTDADGRLSLAGRGGVDGSHQNQLAVRLVRQLLEQGFRELCLIVAVTLDVLVCNGE